jgi:hypothetical protein
VENKKKKGREARGKKEAAGPQAPSRPTTREKRGGGEEGQAGGRGISLRERGRGFFYLFFLF